MLNLTWMAWTPWSVVFFIFIFSLIALMGVLEWRNPGGAPRYGILRLHTTRGDRLFISLLGSAFIFLFCLALFGQNLWIPLVASLIFGGLIFRFA